MATRSTRFGGMPAVVALFACAVIVLAGGGFRSVADAQFSGGLQGRFNEPPVAEFTFAPPNPVMGEPVTFDAGESYDPDGIVERYDWDFSGDGLFQATGTIVMWTFPRAGTYPVTLRVVDNDGTMAVVTRQVTVESFGPGGLEARFDYTPARPRPGDVVTFDAQGTLGGAENVTYEWDFTGDGQTDVVRRGDAQGTWRFEREGVYPVTLRVSDAMGRSARVTRQVIVGPGLVTVVIDSEPEDLTVFIDGNVFGRTPLTLELEPERYELRVRHLWRGEYRADIDLRALDQLELNVILR